MKEKYRIKLYSITSPHDVGNPTHMRQVWETIGSREFTIPGFSEIGKPNQERSVFRIKLDVSDAVKTIKLLEREKSGKPVKSYPKRAFLDVLCESESRYDGEWTISLLKSFLCDLFLAANISAEGCMDAYGNFVDGVKDVDKRGVIPFDSNPFTDAWSCSHRWGWPELQTMDFNKVWKWFELIGVISNPVAVSACQKAIFCLQAVCSQEIRDYPSRLVEILQTIEHLLNVPGNRIAQIMSERISIILGLPSSNRKWLSKLYEQRSKVVHGGASVIRVGYMDDDILEYASEEYLEFHATALSVLLSLIQNLIMNEANGFEFETRHSYKRISS